MDWIGYDPQPRPLAISEPRLAFVPLIAQPRLPLPLLASQPVQGDAHPLDSIFGPKWWIEHCVWKQEM